MHGVALRDLLPLGDVCGGHEDRALVHAAPDGVGVAAVVDEGQARVDGHADLLPLERLGDLVHRLAVVDLGADDLVDEAEDECLQTAQRRLLRPSSPWCRRRLAAKIAGSLQES